mgnify:CR=1 FL=1
MNEEPNTAGREAPQDYAFEDYEAAREAKLWGGRVPTNPVTYYCGDCDERNVGFSKHKPECRNYRGR